jgi:TonB-dependent starch-binding outer membrane protein SusC
MQRIALLRLLKHKLVKRKIAIMFFNLIILSFFFQIAVFANGYSQEITLSAENVPVKKIFREIEKQSDYSFFFNETLLKGAKKVSINVKNVSIKTVLDICFQDQPFSYVIDDKQIIIKQRQLLSKIEVAAVNQASPAIIVKGKVNDDKGAPLIGASVKLKGTPQGTSTDANGNFSLEIPDQGGVLVISYVGYSSIEVPVTSASSAVNVSLQQLDTKAEEIIVIAYGSQNKRAVTGSVQTINAKELVDQPVGQLAQKLQGKVAGAQITQASGRPGEGMNIRVRGQASISGGFEPLYVVDGVPLLGDLGNGQTDIANLNADEIENISILKDAAATALYGSRGANGVVLITTKHAKNGENSLSVNAYTGVQRVPNYLRPQLMNAREFATFKNEIRVESGQQPETYYADVSKFGEGTNWFDINFVNAPINSISVTAASSKEKFNSAITAGYFDQKGVLVNTGYKRYSLRLNTEFKPTERIKLGFNVAPNYSLTNNESNTDGLFWTGATIFNALVANPTLDYKNPDGSIPLNLTNINADNSWFSNNSPNWYRALRDVNHLNKSFSVLSNAYLELELLKALKFKSSISGEYNTTDFKGFRPTTVGGLFNLAPRENYLNVNSNRSTRWVFENTLNYQKSFGAHSFDLLAGYSAQRTDYSRTASAASNLPTDIVQNIDQAAPDRVNSSSSSSSWTLVSGIARLNYNYLGKYLFSASVRNDGSSKFGADNRYATFPAFSVGWVVSDENFLKSVSKLSFLKLRASYGIVGNDAIDLYSTVPSIGVGTRINNGNIVGAATPNSLGNRLLGWEETKQTDIGLDAAFLNNRISLSYDYYNKTTDKLLYKVPTPPSSGYSTIAYNTGSFKYWGHEITISSRNLVNKLKWSTDFNISFLDNKVLSLGTDNQAIYTSFGKTKVGGHIGEFFGYVREGVYKNAADLAKSPKVVGESVVGSPKWKDLNNDGIISVNDETDKTAIGNPSPKFLYGFTNNLSYKNFDLSIVCQGSYGNKIFKAIDQSFGNLDGVFNVYKSVARRWKSETDPGDGYWAVAGAKSGLDRDYPDTRFVHDGSYLTIKNVTLGYTLPFKNLQYIRNIRFYASVQQLYVFTKYDGLNPEVSVTVNTQAKNALTQGIDWSAYPVPRTFTFGINMNIK